MAIRLYGSSSTIKILFDLLSFSNLNDSSLVIGGRLDSK